MKFTEKDLEAMHAQLFETAKASMLRDGTLLPLVFLVFDARDATAELARVGLRTELEECVGPNDGSMPGSVAVVPLNLNATQTVDVLCRMDKKHALLLTHLRAVAPAEVKEPDEIILRTFYEAARVRHADIIARYLRWLAGELNAYAIFKVDETWVASLSKEEAEERKKSGGPEVRHMPNRQEAVCVTYESRTHRAIRRARIVRERPGDESSRVLALEDDPTAFVHIEGRFFDLIPPRTSA